MYSKMLKCKSRINDKTKEIARELWTKHEGIDGILVTVGLCIIALVLCVLMKDRLALFIGNIVTEMSQKASGILQMNS